MDAIEDRAKILENISDLHDPKYHDCLAAIPHIKKFIIDRGLIIYGGTAIDYALRTGGQKIYPDELLTVPDLDFYSPDHVNDAYDLADILYKAGFTSTRTIRGYYVRVMKIDIGDNHWIADIAYAPKTFFDTMSTMLYEGMKIVSPSYQKIDIHNSLCSPFSDPPREVIFNRWKKDVARFNILHKNFPTQIHQPAKLKSVVIPKLINTKFLYHGFAAYALLQLYMVDILKINLPKKILRCAAKINADTITFETPNGVTFITNQPGAIISELKLTNVQKYAPLFNIIPPRTDGMHHKTAVSIQHYDHSLISMNELNLYGSKYKITNVQGVLMYLIEMAQFDPGFYPYYESLLEMVSLCDDEVCQLSLNVFGDHNVSESEEITRARTNNDIHIKTVIDPLPVNYYPDRKRPRPTFDYNSSKYFITDGRLLT